MTREQLSKESPEVFAYLESIEETEHFLEWNEMHQTVFVGMIEAAHKMAASTKSLDEYRKARDIFAAEKLSGDTSWIISVTDAVLEYVEALRQNS